MSVNHSKEQVPRVALLCAGALIAFSIAAAGVGRLTGATNIPPAVAPVVSRDLLFRDQANGAIAVFDAKDPATPIAFVAPESNGFLSGTMRTLARQRLRQNADLEVPFRLTQWADNRLTLEDPTTHRLVDMEAFGLTNEQSFARLLTAKAGS